ncbi:hypothetical protein FB45DRAFT_977986 [Roridomyces roridus]|uniref:FAD-binding domain-containing protein n=1 Tax=Roridomyces roridus TaxID=1738132 RepID=A0AAD7BVN0_9AGAR|nr:hypothetical protein FB45DRAFT_977986 [Roridomyces roridus]
MIEDHPLQDVRPAVLALDIIIIGCGISGLSAAYRLGRAGHKITVLESASQIREVGAGIQVGPNLSRLLIRWGLADRLEQVAVKPQAISFVRYEDGQQLGWTRWGDSMERDYGSPYYNIHRADLLDMLFDLARPYVTLKLNSRVKSVDAERAKVILENGAILSADLIVGADGIRSVVRNAVVGGQPKQPVPTGHAAYRAIISTSDMMKDPQMRALVERREITSWMGPQKHIVGYCIRGGTEYNLVLVHPDTREQESYTSEGSVTKMRADFAGWEPRVQKLLNLVQTTLIWPLMYREPLDDWVSPSGKVVLMGDACHPMLPSRAQGSAMAVEDAAVLGILLSRITSRTQLLPLLHGYQRLRHNRTAETQRAAFANHNTFHLEDGPRQEERDRSMRLAMELASSQEERENVGNANIWADKRKSQTQFGYDAEAEAARWCTGIWLDAARTSYRL